MLNDQRNATTGGGASLIGNIKGETSVAKFHLVLLCAKPQRQGVCQGIQT
jgi:hypothetical protein